ncbi:MAG: prolipoprotein diacylglyceryl transferase [Proteobacteria bacterium]|nr:prolipoprotein diacylglyceryl transferase [Pseudomonadota bacterium]
MIPFPPIDPVAFKLGPVAVHWYGLSYIVGIGLGWGLLHDRAGRGNGRWTRDQVADLVFYAALGGVLGGRIGYILFYNLHSYLSEPLSILAVWRGGMSFHGGAVGMSLALAWFARANQRSFLEVADFLVPVVPIGLGLGRIANFINQELWGAATTQPWGVLFTHPAAGGVARHPTQLYEAFLEGLVLFVILNAIARKPRAHGTLMACFLMLYAVFRFAVEFVREPDAHIGYLAFNWLTMGQLLSVPMFIIGGVMLVAVSNRKG